MDAYHDCLDCGRTRPCLKFNCSDWVPLTRAQKDGVSCVLDAIGAAMTQQVGGNHYKGMAIQPVEFIHKNAIGYMEGNAIKYLCRWRNKNGVEDLKKARHYIDLLIEMEAAK